MRAIVRKDPKDDPVIAAAVAGQAQYLVTYDHHLLDLGKPYGVACVTPMAFLNALVKA
ncbi:MAG: putative toxin-antitoxin system toxin component, PIN family [Limisphaerales bacterium]